MLVCEVAQRHETLGVLTEQHHAAERLQGLLLKLVDERRHRLPGLPRHAPRHSEDRQAAINRVAATPLAIGRTCADLIDLSRAIEEHTRGPLRGDVRAARHLAQAGVRTAVDLATESGAHRG